MFLYGEAVEAVAVVTQVDQEAWEPLDIMSLSHLSVYHQTSEILSKWEWAVVELVEDPGEEHQVVQTEKV